MPSGDTPQDAAIDKVSDQLNDGLKTCRSVLNDYRAILSAPPTPGASESLGSSGEESLNDTFRTQESSSL